MYLMLVLAIKNFTGASHALAPGLKTTYTSVKSTGIDLIPVTQYVPTAFHSLFSQHIFLRYHFLNANDSVYLPLRIGSIAYRNNTLTL